VGSERGSIKRYRKSKKEGGGREWERERAVMDMLVCAETTSHTQIDYGESNPHGGEVRRGVVGD
jgi:hypothetical protein